MDGRGDLEGSLDVVPHAQRGGNEARFAWDGTQYGPGVASPFAHGQHGCAPCASATASSTPETSRLAVLDGQVEVLLAVEPATARSAHRALSVPKRAPQTFDGCSGRGQSPVDRLLCWG